MDLSRNAVLQSQVFGAQGLDAPRRENLLQHSPQLPHVPGEGMCAEVRQHVLAQRRRLPSQGACSLSPDLLRQEWQVLEPIAQGRHGHRWAARHSNSAPGRRCQPPPAPPRSGWWPPAPGRRRALPGHHPCAAPASRRQPSGPSATHGAKTWMRWLATSATQVRPSQSTATLPESSSPSGFCWGTRGRTRRGRIPGGPTAMVASIAGAGPSAPMVSCGPSGRRSPTRGSAFRPGSAPRISRSWAGGPLRSYEIHNKACPTEKGATKWRP